MADEVGLATAAKRAVDLVGGLVLAVVALPLMVVIAALVFLAHGWPVLYGEQRAGL